MQKFAKLTVRKGNATRGLFKFQTKRGCFWKIPLEFQCFSPTFAAKIYPMRYHCLGTY